jgi:hypothetical protein
MDEALDQIALLVRGFLMKLVWVSIRDLTNRHHAAILPSR